MEETFLSEKSSVMQVIPVEKHGITKEKMDKDAIKIVKTLQDSGYQAYLVGGCIRDHIAGHKPKDYDIVTNARPNKILKLFDKSLLIGRRFPLVHVRVPGKRGKVIEVATFRTKYADVKLKNKFCRWLQKFFIFGNIAQDAFRRDLTVHALYWRLNDEALLDFHGGYKDAKEKKIVVIGESDKRIQEDPVRILRIIKVKAKLDYTLTQNQQNLLFDYKNLLQGVSPSRLYGELVKCMHGGFGESFFNLMLRLKLNNIILPGLVTNKNAEKWIVLGLRYADKRYHAGLSLSAGYLFAVLLWPMYLKSSNKNAKYSSKTSAKIIQKQQRKTIMPKKIIIMIEQIWKLQAPLLKVSNHKEASKLVQQNFFRAAYDFLLLRADFSSEYKQIAESWTKYLALNKSEKESFLFNEVEDL